MTLLQILESNINNTTYVSKPSCVLTTYKTTRYTARIVNLIPKPLLEAGNSVRYFDFRKPQTSAIASSKIEYFSDAFIQSIER